MTFKRPRLRSTNWLVNVSLVSMMSFLAACGSDKAEIPAETGESAVSAELQDSNGTITLPAVWATSPLAEPITDLAFAGGINPILAVSLQSGALQLFDLQGDRITEAVNLGVASLGTGRTVDLDGALLTLFPGLGLNGTLNLYAFNSALGEPVPFRLLPDTQASVLCTSDILADEEIIFRLAYGTPGALTFGDVVRAGGEFVWQPTDRSDPDSLRCVGTNSAQVSQSDLVYRQETIVNRTGSKELTLQADGDLFVGTASRPVLVRDGITVKAPAQPSAMAALSSVQFGGYPNGVVVLGGDVDGESVITFIEPGPLFGIDP